MLGTDRETGSEQDNARKGQEELRGVDIHGAAPQWEEVEREGEDRGKEEHGRMKRKRGNDCKGRAVPNIFQTRQTKMVDSERLNFFQE